jgi:uncharacterized protein YebE (UPF0316 family)
MRQDHFISATAIVIIYVIIKVLETKFVLKEEICIKKLVTDAVCVYISVIVGVFVIEQVSSTIDTKSTFAFTSNPDF